MHFVIRAMDFSHLKTCDAEVGWHGTARDAIDIRSSQMLSGSSITWISWILACAGMPCFYETLRIARRASLEEIKLAFKKIALEVHPDKGGNKEAFHKAAGDCH